MSGEPKPEQPIVFVKGRGAGSNRPSRYVRDEPDDDLDYDPSTRKTEVTERQAKSLLNRNQSPDLSFDFTINPIKVASTAASIASRDPPTPTSTCRPAWTSRPSCSPR